MIKAFVAAANLLLGLIGLAAIIFVIEYAFVR